MRRTTIPLVLVAAVACLLLPAASFAQSAGDEQYVDPFQNDTSQGGGGGGSGGGGGGGGSQGTSRGGQEAQTGGDTGSTGGDTGSSGAVGGTTDVAPPASTPESGDATATAAPTTGSSTPTLPTTGLPAVLVLLLGGAFVGGGVALRRGTREVGEVPEAAPRASTLAGEARTETAAVTRLPTMLVILLGAALVACAVVLRRGD